MNLKIKNLNEVYAELSKETEVNYHKVAQVLNGYWRIVEESLRAGVQINGGDLGTFYPRHKKPALFVFKDTIQVKKWGDKQ